MDKPHRVQLSRKKGWRMPPDTLSVARPGKWGNPYVFSEAEGGRSRAVAAYRDLLFAFDDPVGWPEHIGELRGKNLACWCRLDQPCHADVLLELANRPA